MDHLETTKRVRAEIKAKGIKASVFKQHGNGGSKCVYVSTASYEQSFTLDEMREINLIVMALGLTGVQGSVVTEKDVFQSKSFYIPQV